MPSSENAIVSHNRIMRRDSARVKIIDSRTQHIMDIVALKRDIRRTNIKRWAILHLADVIDFVVPKRDTATGDAIDVDCRIGGVSEDVILKQQIGGVIARGAAQRDESFCSSHW